MFSRINKDSGVIRIRPSMIWLTYGVFEAGRANNRKGISFHEISDLEQECINLLEHVHVSVSLTLQVFKQERANNRKARGICFLGQQRLDRKASLS